MSNKKDEPLDQLCREFIRKRAMVRAGGCERCLTPKVSYKDLQAAYCHGKGKHSTRWDIDNLLGLCGGCHRYIDSQFAAKVELFTEVLGKKKFDLLWIRAMKPCRYIDRLGIKIFLQAEIKKLEAEHGIIL